MNRELFMHIFEAILVKAVFLSHTILPLTFLPSIQFSN